MKIYKPMKNYDLKDLFFDLLNRWKLKESNATFRFIGGL